MPLESSAFDQAVSSAANPLQGMTSMADAYQQALKMRQGSLEIQKTYGEQQVGQALQQATDPTTGVLDTQKAMRIAAGMGPNTAFAMQGFLKTSSELRGAQITQAGKLDDLVTTLSASAISDSSDENMARIRARGVANGMSPSQLAEVDRIAALPEGQRKLEAWKHLSGQMGASYNLAAGGYPTPVPTTFGGTTAPVTIQPRTPYGPGGMAVGGGVAHTVSPETYYGPRSSIIMYDANGQETTDPTKAVSKVPRDIPSGPAMGAPPPGSVGAPPPAAPGAAPPLGALPPGAPPPPAGTRLVGGRFATPSAAPAPNASTPPPAPAPTAGVVTGLPTGTEKSTETGIEADQKQFIADRTVLPQRQTQEQNLRHAYDALKLITTGKGTENASAIRNLLTTVGLAPPAMANDEAIYEYGRKYLERTIAEAGNVGGTDTARALAAQSNPNVSLVNPANLAFLRNDIGKIRQQMVPYMTAPDTTIGKGYGKHSADTASNTDYRGFNWDDYSEPEQKRIMKEVGPEGTKAHDALARAIGMGRAFWPLKSGGPIIPHAEAAPSSPPPNMFAMAQPQSNPLLAA